MRFTTPIQRAPPPSYTPSTSTSTSATNRLSSRWANKKGGQRQQQQQQQQKSSPVVPGTSAYDLYLEQRASRRQNHQQRNDTSSPSSGAASDGAGGEGGKKRVALVPIDANSPPRGRASAKRPVPGRSRPPIIGGGDDEGDDENENGWGGESDGALDGESSRSSQHGREDGAAPARRRNDQRPPTAPAPSNAGGGSSGGNQGGGVETPRTTDGVGGGSGKPPPSSSSTWRQRGGLRRDVMTAASTPLVGPTSKVSGSGVKNSVKTKTKRVGRMARSVILRGVLHATSTGKGGGVGSSSAREGERGVEEKEERGMQTIDTATSSTDADEAAIRLPFDDDGVATQKDASVPRPRPPPPPWRGGARREKENDGAAAAEEATISSALEASREAARREREGRGQRAKEGRPRPAGASASEAGTRTTTETGTTAAADTISSALDASREATWRERQRERQKDGDRHDGGASVGRKWQQRNRPEAVGEAERKRIPPPPPPPLPLPSAPPPAASIWKERAKAHEDESRNEKENEGGGGGGNRIDEDDSDDDDDDPCFREFLDDLRRELASDHTELWRGFQAALGDPPGLSMESLLSDSEGGEGGGGDCGNGNSTTTQSKRRLDPRSQRTMAGINRSLKDRASAERSGSGASSEARGIVYRAKSQLVSDSQGRREQDRDAKRDQEQPMATTATMTRTSAFTSGGRHGRGLVAGNGAAAGVGPALSAPGAGIGARSNSGGSTGSNVSVVTVFSPNVSSSSSVQKRKGKDPYSAKRVALKRRSNVGGGVGPKFLSPQRRGGGIPRRSLDKFAPNSWAPATTTRDNANAVGTPARTRGRGDDATPSSSIVRTSSAVSVFGERIRLKKTPMRAGAGAANNSSTARVVESRFDISRDDAGATTVTDQSTNNGNPVVSAELAPVGDQDNKIPGPSPEGPSHPEDGAKSVVTKSFPAQRLDFNDVTPGKRGVIATAPIASRGMHGSASSSNRSNDAARNRSITTSRATMPRSFNVSKDSSVVVAHEQSNDDVEGEISVFGERIKLKKTPHKAAVPPSVSRSHNYSDGGPPLPKDLAGGEALIRDGQSSIQTTKSGIVDDSSIPSTPITKFAPSISHVRDIQDSSMASFSFKIGDVVDTDDVRRVLCGNLATNDEPDENVTTFWISNGNRALILGHRHIVITSRIGPMVPSSSRGFREGKILWFASRADIRSLTLDGEASGAEITLANGSSQLLNFSSALETLEFAQAFYASKAATPSKTTPSYSRQSEIEGAEQMGKAPKTMDIDVHGHITRGQSVNSRDVTRPNENNDNLARETPSSNREPSSPRNALVDSIKQRNVARAAVNEVKVHSNEDLLGKIQIPEVVTTKDATRIDPRSALLGAIKSRTQMADVSNEDEQSADPRRALLGAIKSRQQVAESPAENDHADARSSLLGAIKSHKQATRATEQDQGDDSRSAVLGAIQSQKQVTDPTKDGVSADHRSALLGAIKSQKSIPETTEDVASSDPRSALLGAIASRKPNADAPEVAVSADPRRALLGAIKSRKQLMGDSSEDTVSADPRSAMLGAIKSRNPIRDTTEVTASADPRSALLGAITSRKPQTTVTSEVTVSADPRSALLGAIKSRKQLMGDSSEDAVSADPRSALLGAIKSRKPIPDTTEVTASADPRSALLGTIKSRKQRMPDTSNDAVGADPRSALLGAIKSRKQMADTSDDAVSADPRSALLKGINDRMVASEEHESTGNTADPRSALLAAIAGRTKPNEANKTVTGSTIVSHGMTEEERKAVNKFKSMIKMGVPREAVRHKMTLERIDDSLVRIVLAFDDENCASKREPGQTSNQEVLPASRENNNTGFSKEEDGQIAKYKKMLRLSIPKEAVRHKMKMDGIGSAVLVAVLGPDEALSEQKHESTPLTQAEEVVAAKYRKMLKINIPKDAVRHKMIQEQVNEKVMHAVVGRQNSISPKKCGAGMTSAPSRKAAKGPDNKLVSLHWTPLTPKTLEKSIWGKKVRSTGVTVRPEDNEVKRLEEMFRKKSGPKPTKKEGANENDVKSNKMAKLIDINRAQNVSIGLKAFKDFKSLDLAMTLSDLDPENRISGERIQFIKSLLPTHQEAKVVKAYRGEDSKLDPAELFFRHLLRVKRIDQKVHALHTMVTFPDNTQELSKGFHLLSQVCRQVMESDRLQRVLETILRIGNIMNEGTRTGGAAGFKFDSLLKLTQTKSTDGKTTVLDFLVMTFVAKNERDVLDLAAEFPASHEASNLLIADMTGEVKKLQAGVRRCETELTLMKQDQVEGLSSVKFSPGVTRLENFISRATVTLSAMEKAQDLAVNACKEMATFFGESGGERSASQLLSILSQFVKNLCAAVKKHNEREQAEIRKAASAQKKNRGADGKEDATTQQKNASAKMRSQGAPDARKALLGAIASRAREGPSGYKRAMPAAKDGTRSIARTNVRKSSTSASHANDLAVKASSKHVEKPSNPSSNVRKYPRSAVNANAIESTTKGHQSTTGVKVAARSAKSETMKTEATSTPNLSGRKSSALSSRTSTSTLAIALQKGVAEAGPRSAPSINPAKTHRSTSPSRDSESTSYSHPHKNYTIVKNMDGKRSLQVETVMVKKNSRDNVSRHSQDKSKLSRSTSKGRAKKRSAAPVYSTAPVHMRQEGPREIYDI